MIFTIDGTRKSPISAKSYPAYAAGVLLVECDSWETLGKFIDQQLVAIDGYDTATINIKVVGQVDFRLGVFAKAIMMTTDKPNGFQCVSVSNLDEKVSQMVEKSMQYSFKDVSQTDD